MQVKGHEPGAGKGWIDGALLRESGDKCSG